MKPKKSGKTQSKKMQKYDCKCVILGRLAWDPKYPERPVFVRTFRKNNAHLTGEVPKDTPEFQNIKIMRITGIDVDYFTEGSDLVINNLKYVEIGVDPKDKTTLIVTGKQD